LLPPTMSNAVPQGTLRSSYIPPPTNQAVTPPVAYNGSPQYTSPVPSPPAGQQYPQWTGQPTGQPTGATPGYQPQQQITPGYQQQQVTPGYPQQQVTPGYQQQQITPGYHQQQVSIGYQYYQGTPQYFPQQPSAPLTAMPIPALNKGSAPVDCPVCGARGLTSTRKVVGSSNQLSLRFLPVYAFTYRFLHVVCGRLLLASFSALDASHIYSMISRMSSILAVTAVLTLRRTTIPEERSLWSVDKSTWVERLFPTDGLGLRLSYFYLYVSYLSKPGTSATSF
jgi:hypothetical protein